MAVALEVVAMSEPWQWGRRTAGNGPVRIRWRGPAGTCAPRVRVGVRSEGLGELAERESSGFAVSSNFQASDSEMISLLEMCQKSRDRLDQITRNSIQAQGLAPALTRKQH